MRYWPALVVALLLASCSAPKTNPEAAAQDSSAARTQAIPDAKPELYGKMKDMKNWRNPYLIIRKDAVGLLDVNDNEEITLKPEEVTKALADLPPSAWPYGRVVAVQALEGAASEPDKAEIRRTKGIVAGTLEELRVVIHWVPSA